MLFLIGGILLVISGLLTLEAGDHMWRDTIVPGWTAWPKIILGLAVCGLSLWNLRRNKDHLKRPACTTDEEAAKAEAEMDAMYVRDHGELPDKNQKDD